MKRGVILSATVLTMTVATGAHLLATSYQGAPVAAPVAATPIQKASLEIRQAPVPLQVKQHSSVKLATADATVAPAKSEASSLQTSASESAASTTSDPSSESTARPTVEADRSATSPGTVRIYLDDTPRAPDRRTARVEPDATAAAVVRAAGLWRVGYAVSIVLSKAHLK